MTYLAALPALLTPTGNINNRFAYYKPWLISNLQT